MGCEGLDLCDPPGDTIPGACDASKKVFPAHLRFANLVTAKNLSVDVRPWGLERAPIDEIHATKSCKPSVIAQFLRGALPMTRFLFDGSCFETQRGETPTFYDRGIRDLDKRLSIFSGRTISPGR